MNKIPFVIANKISKQYSMGRGQRLDVLKGLDFKIKQGEIIAVIGPSGVGKSTLLHIMGGLDRPTSGDVVFKNNTVSRLNNQELADFRNKHVGFVFQFHHLLPEFNALENVCMPGFIKRQKNYEIKERAHYLLDEMGLSQRMHHKPGELSGGEQQRVAFARALMNDPDLVLADEPSGNLDLKNAQSLHELMWKLVHEKNKTFVVVTHNQSLASKADRVIELFDGKIKP